MLTRSATPKVKQLIVLGVSDRVSFRSETDTSLCIAGERAAKK